jgi:hypothetical protein
VLLAAREGTLVTGLPADLADRLAPLDQVLDTYADLLVADGIHALVTGRGDLANAAMEAAAGLGPPPDLRAVRTPRQAATVRVSAWTLLPSATAAADANADPARVADPAYAAALDTAIGADAISSKDPDIKAKRARFAGVLGGAEGEGMIPSLTGGEYEVASASPDADLRIAIAKDLTARLNAIVGLAQDTHDALVALDPSAAGSQADVKSAAARWRVDLSNVFPEDPTMTEPTVDELRIAAVTALADRLSEAATAPVAGATAPPDGFFSAVRRAIRSVVGRPDLPVLPNVDRSLLPIFRTNGELDKEWLEIVAAVRPRLTALDASQLDPASPNWTAAVATPDSSIDPWHSSGPVVVAYGPGVDDGGELVAVAVLDSWTDSVPAQRHTTFAAFGFNSPKSRAPQAVLVAVPPDVTVRLDNAGLLDVVLETRELVHARAPRQIPEPTLPHVTSTAFVSAKQPRNFLDRWTP